MLQRVPDGPLRWAVASRLWWAYVDRGHRHRDGLGVTYDYTDVKRIADNGIGQSIMEYRDIYRGLRMSGLTPDESTYMLKGHRALQRWYSGQGKRDSKPVKVVKVSVDEYSVGSYQCCEGE